MKKPRVGDTVWWFGVGSKGGFEFGMVSNLILHHKVIESESESRLFSSCYTSRRQALEALSARLKELLDESNT